MGLKKNSALNDLSVARPFVLRTMRPACARYWASPNTRRHAGMGMAFVACCNKILGLILTTSHVFAKTLSILVSPVLVKHGEMPILEE